MKKLFAAFLFIAAIAIGVIVWVLNGRFNTQPSIPQQSQDDSFNEDVTPQDLPLTTLIAQGLDTPWAIAFLPDGDMLVTERKGTVLLVDGDVQNEPIEIASISNVREIGEGGLLGITLHPDFQNNNFVYLYYTYGGNESGTLNRVVRMTYSDNALSNETIILDEIPGAPNHNGGRIAFGPEGYLYVATGDAQNPSLAQNVESLAGKILRITDNGEPVPGNPFDNSVYSYGHRNPQGLSWDSDNQLWSTEHGPSGGAFGSGNDELNKINIGENYGWPEIQGDQQAQGMQVPYVHSGRETTWAPGGNAIVGNTLFFSGLRGAGLYSIDLTDESREVSKHFDNEYGRLREVVEGPDGMIYITTSNRDGRGIPNADDDKIIRVNPNKL